uniref:Isoform 3 of Putative postmeiotic segregation increased 2-like protein 3 n=1 Tax=Homo sapiens TaxID=9606 RepID=Q13401-3
MNTLQGPVSFKDVAVDFTQEEWRQLDPDEKIAYGDVMLENYSHLVSVGYDYHQAKHHHGVEVKEVEQGEEPWIMEGEFPCQHSPVQNLLRPSNLLIGSQSIRFALGQWY